MSRASPRQRAHGAVLELLERRHGIGRRGEALPAWVELRLDRALDAVAAGDPLRAVEVLRDDPARLAEVADLLRVGETSFYRDPPQWDALRSVVIPEFARRERVRALSVGCSSGEEAWTLAMLLDEARPGKSASYRVLGSDRSVAALAAARDGRYDEAALGALPSELAARYLERADGVARVCESLRSAVSFVARDAMQGPAPGRYEILVCKNLFIYFGDAALARVVSGLFRALAEGGVLLVAKSEVPRVRALGHAAAELAPGVVGFRA